MGRNSCIRDDKCDEAGIVALSDFKFAKGLASEMEGILSAEELPAAVLSGVGEGVADLDNDSEEPEDEEDEEELVSSRSASAVKPSEECPLSSLSLSLFSPSLDVSSDEYAPALPNETEEDSSRSELVFKD